MHYCLWFRSLLSHCGETLPAATLPPSPDHPSSVPADKRCTIKVGIIVGLCSSRWPGDCEQKQEELQSLESNERPLEAVFFLEEIAESLTSLDCITICQA